MLPISISWLYTKEVLVMIGVHVQIAQYSYNYLVRVLPGLWFFLAFDVIRRFLQAQGFFWPCLWVNIITCLTHIVLCYIFVVYLNLYELGAGYATCITYIATFIIGMKLVYQLKLDTSWLSLDMTNFSRQIVYYLKFALPSAASYILDQINYDVTQYEANLLGVDEQTAHIGVSNTSSMIFSIVIGISVSTSVFVGKFLGEGNNRKAKVYGKAGVCLICAIILPILGLIILFRDDVCRQYTYDLPVRYLMARVLILTCIFCLIDAIQFVIYGILKGLAKQKEASIAIFCSYYILALPLGYYLAFSTSWRLYGIWIGMIIGAVMTLLLMTGLLIKARWVAVTVKSED